MPLPVVAAPQETGAADAPLGVFSDGDIPYGARATGVRNLIVILSGLGSLRTAPLQMQKVATCAEAAVLCAVLLWTAGDECDVPMRLFLAMFLVKDMCALPANLYLSRHPLTFTRSAENEIIHDYDSHSERYLEVSVILNFLVLMYGNMVFFSSETCGETSAPLYYATLVTLIAGWVVASQVLILVALVIAFLPFIFIFMRVFHWDIAPVAASPLNRDQLAQIPLVVYVPEADSGMMDTSTRPVYDPVPGAAFDGVRLSQPVPVHPPPRPRNFVARLRSWFSRAQPAATVPDEEHGLLAAGKPPRYGTLSRYASCVYPHHLIPESQSTCAICLQDFVPPPLSGSDAAATQVPDPLRLLPCGHCFHVECCDSWLSTSGRCPMCLRGVATA